MTGISTLLLYFPRFPATGAPTELREYIVNSILYIWEPPLSCAQFSLLWAEELRDLVMRHQICVHDQTPAKLS